MKNIPDNIVFNNQKLEYDAFKKPYPTNISSPNFQKPSIKKISNTAITILKTKFDEISKDYQALLENIKYNELMYTARCDFITITGETYYLYSKKDYNFISIIKPNEWNEKFLGSFTLTSNDLWERKSN